MAGPRVIALEYNTPMLIDVVAELNKRHGWEPVYCVSYGTRELVKKHFPKAAYQDTHDARYGRPAPELASLQPVVIDQPTAEALGYAEVVALKQMDRMELMGGFALHDRILHFNKLVAYWSAVFDQLRPDVLLTITSPHVVYDYVAYVLARRRSIRTVLFEYVTTEGLMMAIDRFEDGMPPLVAEYQRLRAAPPSQVALSGRLEAYWQRLKGTHEQALPAWTRKFQADGEARRQDALAARAPGSSILGVLGGALRSKPAPGSRPAVDGHYGGRFYSRAPDDLASAAAEYRLRHAESVQRRYEELAAPPNLQQPFIYVPLHMQPERSTNPNGGVFDDQDVMIGLLASALPAGWHIYVKEHPSQFLHGLAIERGRWESFYDAVLAHRSVSFVPVRYPSFDLIDRSRAVATITGTSGWEAAVRGVPALLFGEAWFKGCDGVHTVRTAEDARQAIARIAEGQRPDPAAVRLFLHAAEKTAFFAHINDDEKELSGVDEPTNIANLARAIADCYVAKA